MADSESIEQVLTDIDRWFDQREWRRQARERGHPARGQQLAEVIPLRRAFFEPSSAKEC